MALKGFTTGEAVMLAGARRTEQSVEPEGHHEDGNG
jgi:hypothetical protein